MTSPISPATFDSHPPRIESHLSNSPTTIDTNVLSILSNPMPGTSDYGMMQESNIEINNLQKTTEVKSPTVCIEELSWNVSKTLESKGSLNLASNEPKPLANNKFPMNQKSPLSIPSSPSTTTISTTSMGSSSSSPRPQRSFKIGDLVWGAVRGTVAWPGKIVNGPDGEPTSSDCVWVKWFGERRQHTEMVLTNKLQSLSEGLEAHHAAQKESRK
jgi:hypothetical protein